MKKKFYFLVLFLFGGFAFADCDIEVSTKPLSFYQAKDINFGTLYYRESLIFRYTGYICDISNFNYFLLDEKLGFYDSLNVIYKDRLGLELALGPCFKFYEGMNVDLYGRLGFHSSFFFEYLNLGLESGIGLKFFNKKRVSPVAGLNFFFKAQLFAQAQNVVVHRAGFAHVVIPPGRFQQALAAERNVAVQQQCFQQAVLLWGQVNRCAVQNNRVRCQIHLQPAPAKALGIFAHAAQNRLNAC